MEEKPVKCPECGSQRNYKAGIRYIATEKSRGTSAETAPADSRLNLKRGYTTPFFDRPSQIVVGSWGLNQALYGDIGVDPLFLRHTEVKAKQTL